MRTTAPRLHSIDVRRVLLPGADVDGRGLTRLDKLERRASAVERGRRPLGGRNLPPEPPSAAPEPCREPPRRGTPAPAPRGHPQLRAPAPAPRREPPASAPPVPEPPAPSDSARHDPAQPDTAGIRATWPQVLDAVSRRRRVVWIVLRENAQVQHFDGQSLRLSIDNQGAFQTFMRTGGPDLLRESLLEVMGIAPEVEAVLAGETPPARPATTPPPPRQEEPPSPHIAAARRNVEPTRVGPPEDEPEEEPDRDDVDLDTNDMAVDDLIINQLGAELIGEEETSID